MNDRFRLQQKLLLVLYTPVTYRHIVLLRQTVTRSYMEIT